MNQIVMERCIADPILALLRPLYLNFGLEIASTPPSGNMEPRQWFWAQQWIHCRNNLEDGLLNALNDEHEAWLEAINPNVRVCASARESEQHRLECFACFDRDELTPTYMLYMRQTVADLLRRLARRVT